MEEEKARRAAFDRHHETLARDQERSAEFHRQIDPRSDSISRVAGPLQNSRSPVTVSSVCSSRSSYRDIPDEPERSRSRWHSMHMVA